MNTLISSPQAKPYSEMDLWQTRPQALQACLEALSRPHSCAGDLSRLAALDPVLAGKFLVEASHMDRDPQAGIFSLPLAARRLGKRRIEEIVFSSYTRQLSYAPDLAGMEEFWRGSVAMARACQEIFELDECGSRDLGEEAYLCGLLADFGKLALRPQLSGLDWASASCEEERLACGTDHAVMGAKIAAEWGLPESYCEAVLNHHGKAGDGWTMELLQRAAARVARPGVPS